MYPYSHVRLLHVPHLFIVQITEAFDLKVNILKKTLQESVQKDLQNGAIQCGADLIVKLLIGYLAVH